LTVVASGVVVATATRRIDPIVEVVRVAAFIVPSRRVVVAAPVRHGSILEVRALGADAGRPRAQSVRAVGPERPLDLSQQSPVKTGPVEDGR
jgi:hypothetical protein